MKVPALAPRAPLGAMCASTGSGEASTARTISRIEVSSPPGVSMRSTTTAAPRCCAWASPRTT